MFRGGCGASACSVGGGAARVTGKGPSARALRICVEECGGALGVQQTVSLFFENLLRNNFAIPEHNFH